MTRIESTSLRPSPLPSQIEPQAANAGASGPRMQSGEGFVVGDAQDRERRREAGGVIEPAAPCAPGQIMVATYNVENLFDTQYDPAIDDREFTPEGKANWTEAKYETKLDHLARVIRSVNGGRGPDLLGLEEIENRQVLEDLSGRLGDLGYRIVHLDSEDKRGIDTAILARKDFALIGEPKLHRVHATDPNDPVWHGDTTRGILEATFDVMGSPLTLFVNHWPSKRGGAATNARREQAATKLHEVIAAREAQDPSSEIVAVGDFNTNPGDAVFGAHGLQATGSVKTLLAGAALVYDSDVDSAARLLPRLPTEVFEDLGRFDALRSRELGPMLATQVFRRDEQPWNILDMVFLGKATAPGDKVGLAMTPGSAAAVTTDFNLNRDGSPRRTFQSRDPRRTSPAEIGYSDHLMKVVRLEKVKS